MDLVLLNWGQPADPPPAGWINDLPTGTIDQNELDGVLLNWNDRRSQSAATVPEPSTMNFSKIWTEQCEAARGIEAEFGTRQALDYLIGEKFLNFLEAADEDPAFRAEIPALVSEIKTIFERWQLAEYLETARETEPFNPADYDDPENAGFARQDDLRRSAADLLLVERAREWLLEE